MRQIDRLYTDYPFYGSRRITVTLKREGRRVNRKHVQRLMATMGLQGLQPSPGTSRPRKEHLKYPYLLRGVHIDRPNHVWSTDITYIPLQHGFMYLTAVIDWYSRYVLSWELSNTLNTDFCIDALEKALTLGEPEIFNTDQGCQFTSEAFTTVLKHRGIKISMDGRGRALDNVFIERLWRSVKYEDIYLKDYDQVPALYRGLRTYFKFFNEERPHQSLGYVPPAEMYVI